MDKDTQNQNNQSLTRVISEGVFVSSAGSLINKFSGLATSLIKIKILTLFQYGILSLTSSIVYLFNGFVTLGIGNVVIADLNISKGENKYNTYKALLFGYIKFVTFLAIILWAILFFGAEFISSFYDDSVLPYIKIFSFLLFTAPLRSLYTVILKTHLKFKLLAKLSVLESYLNLFLIVILVWFMKLGIEGVLYAELIYHFTSLLIFTPICYKIGAYLVPIKRSKENYFWQIFKNHGKWATATNYLGDLTKRIRPWFIAYFLSVEAVAIFSVAQSLFSHITSLLSISDVLAQIFPQQIKNKIKTSEIFYRSFKYSMYIFIAIGMGGLLVVPWLVDWFFPKYHDSLLIFRIFILIVPILALIVLQTPIYNAMQRQKDMFFLTAVSNLIMIVLSVALIPVYGIVGSALENVITIYLYTIIRYLHMKRISKEIAVNWKNLFKFDTLDKDILNKIFIRLGFKK